MKRSILNYWLSVASFLVMLGLIVTGITTRYILPPGTGGREGGPRLTAWGLGRHDWGEVHFWLAVSLVVLLAVHVALHWTWVVTTTRRLLRAGADHAPGRRTSLIGAIFAVGLVLVVGVLVWVMAAGVERTPGGFGARHGPPGRPRVHETEAGPATRAREVMLSGRTTLAEAAAAVGEHLDRLIERLGLPTDTSPDERLGRLARQRGMTLAELRDRILSDPGSR